jgi:hypothetical protein
VKGVDRVKGGGLALSLTPAVGTEAMGTLGVHLKGVLPCLVRWACRAGTIDCWPALVSPV